MSRFLKGLGGFSALALAALVMGCGGDGSGTGGAGGSTTSTSTASPTGSGGAPTTSTTTASSAASSSSGTQTGQGGGGGGDPCAACPTSCCNNACVDFATASAHCGQCGHDCEGGTCQAAVCQAVAVGSGHLVGVDATDVYVANGMVTKYPVAGGAGVPIGSLTGTRFFLGTDAVYATTTGNQGSVQSLSFGGVNATLASSENNPTYPLQVGTNVYWGTTGGVVRRASTLGGAPTNFITGQQIPFELKSDGAKIYFTDTLAQKLKRSDLVGVLGVADNVPSAERLVVDGTFIYLTGPDVIYQTLASGFGGGISTAVTLPNSSPIHCLARDGGATLIGTDEGLRQGTTLLVPGGPVVEVFADAKRIYFERSNTAFKLVK